MTLQLGDTAPDFEADTTEGRIKFHDWIGDSWTVLFSHPKDFTPVCTTELGYMANAKPEFDKRDVKIIGLSVDPLGKHEEWAKDIEETQGTAPNYPIISDADFNVSKLYGMLPQDVSGDPGERTPADNQTVRNVFVIGPDKKVKLIFIYPMTTGRNFDEVLRVIDSLQLTAKHKVATPVNWRRGEDVIIAGSVTNDQAKEIYPDGWESRARTSASCRSRRASNARAPGRRRASARGRLARTGSGERQPRAGVARPQPFEQVLENPERRAPDDVAVGDVRIGLERDAAPFDRRACAALLKLAQGQLEHDVDLARGDLPALARGDLTDERMDQVIRRERRDRRQLAEQLDGPAREPDLLFGLAQRGHAQIGVIGVAPAAGERDLAGVAAQVSAALGQDDVRRVGLGHDDQRHEHGRERLSLAVVRRQRPARRALLARRVGGTGRQAAAVAAQAAMWTRSTRSRNMTSPSSTRCTGHFAAIARKRSI